MLNLGLSPMPASGGRKSCASARQNKAGHLNFFRWFLSLLLPITLTSSAFAAVVLNEIMYHPASGNLLESYVELRNTDNITTNISGWRFTKGIQFTFPTNTPLFLTLLQVSPVPSATTSASKTLPAH